MIAHDKIRFTARYPDRLFIGGEWQASSGGGRLSIINPATELEVANVVAASTADVERAIALAYDAFHNGRWPLLPAADRASTLRRIGNAVRARQVDLAHAVTLEMGATLKETLAGVQATAALFDYYADMAEALADGEARPWAGGHAFVAYRPVGVVAAIVPWNAPLSLSVLKLAPALAAGCTVLLKPAPTTPLDAIILAECLEDAGMPPGVVSVLPGGSDVGEILVRDPRVDKITFTGSTGVGRHIGAICGERISRQALELGGKSAAIVLDDMDAGTVAERLVPASLRLTGQACSALTRVLVPQHRHNDVVDAIAAAFATVRPGDPFADSSIMGPLAIDRQRNRVETYIAAGIYEGARLVTGGKRPDHLDRGFYLEATLFSGVRNDMIIAKEEIFGPVVSVIAYSDEDEAVKIANQSDYGLYASIFTHDDEAVFRLAPKLRVGNVSRAGLYIDRRLPYGGFKQSGVSREGGIEGFRSFQEIQTLYLPSAAAAP